MSRSRSVERCCLRRSGRLPIARPMFVVAAGLCGLLACAGRLPAADGPQLRVAPESGELVGGLARIQLQVETAQDGRTVDVTRRATYISLAPTVVQVDAQGRVAPLTEGEAQVEIRHGGRVARTAITVRGLSSPAVASFREDVIPVLTRAGCNQGACHGAQYGQGGFLLSLFGFWPEKDFPRIVREERQRRISLLKPEDSLLLRKGMMDVPHGGGRRFGPESEDATVLRTWLAAGAPGPRDGEAGVVALAVQPAGREVRVGDACQIRVQATYADGTVRDVTHRARFDSLSDAVATVDDRGHVTVAGKGQAAVMVRYQGRAAIAHFLSPFAENVDLSGFRPRNFVDELVLARWKKLGIEPSEVCDDATFLRRAFLDTLGTPPPLEKIEAFAASDDPGKREALVDELLGLTGDPQRDVHVEAWSAYWALKWGDLLRNNRNDLGEGGMFAFHNWMRQAFRENRPIDRFVREIVVAQGSIYSEGPANFYKVETKPEELAETTAQVFLGVRLQCAKCHDHPFESFSQHDYYGLAAFFTRVGTKSTVDFGALGGDTVVLVKSTGSIRHPRTGREVPPTRLLGGPIDAAGVRDLRRPLAEWLTSAENPWFAKNVVNRTWAYFLGSGLVEPIDDLRATNPASNPELFDALAADFVRNGFDLRKLMRAVLVSRVYQGSSTPRPANTADVRFYPHYVVKRLPAEVLLDAIDHAAGTRERFPGVPLGTRAIELPDPNFASYFLDTLGRPKRVVACECERTTEPNLAQVLQIANGELLQRKLTDDKGRVAKLSSDKIPLEAALKELYLVTLCRPPTDREQEAARGLVAQSGSRREGLEDVLWALLNSREFLFNH